MRCVPAAALAPLALATLLSQPALAGPPYVNDDPVPTDEGHFETYLFVSGAVGHDGHGGATGARLTHLPMSKARVKAALAAKG